MTSLLLAEIFAPTPAISPPRCVCKCACDCRSSSLICSRWADGSSLAIASSTGPRSTSGALGAGSSRGCGACASRSSACCCTNLAMLLWSSSQMSAESRAWTALSLPISSSMSWRSAATCSCRASGSGPVISARMSSCLAATSCMLPSTAATAPHACCACASVAEDCASALCAARVASAPLLRTSSSSSPQSAWTLSACWPKSRHIDATEVLRSSRTSAAISILACCTALKISATAPLIAWISSSTAPWTPDWNSHIERLNS
mmetsp:Transcript_13909/g.39588  ORF Transcript_13909/g.39588 Transcript_13909/m.39588 type:complete len:262 (-) Transcript_13909:580-1365(-)